MRFLIIVLSALFTACASSNAVLVNDKGEQEVCHVESFGILIPHVAAKKEFDQCIKNAQMKGYTIKSQD